MRRTFQGSVVVLHREDSDPPVVEVGVEVVPALPAEVAAVVVLPVEAEEDPVAEEDNTLDFIQHKQGPGKCQVFCFKLPATQAKPDVEGLFSYRPSQEPQFCSKRIDSLNPLFHYGNLLVLPADALKDLSGRPEDDLFQVLFYKPFVRHLRPLHNSKVLNVYFLR